MAETPTFRETEYGAGKLKQHSVAEIETAIARALSDLAGTTLQVRVSALDFGSDGIPAGPTTLSVRVSEPIGF